MPTFARAAVALAVSLSMGCVTTGLGRPPADVDLANDGSPYAKAELLDTYSLAYREQTILRPGADPAALGVDEVSARAASDEAIHYIGSSEAAGAELETAGVAAHRFVENGNLHMLVYAGSAALGLGIAVAASTPSVIASLQDPGSNQDALYGAAISAVVGAIIGMIAAAPLSVVANWTVTPLAQAAADGDYRRAVRTYNRELTERIERAGPGAPAAAPQVAPQAAPPAGQPVPPPPPVTPREVDEPAPQPADVVEEEPAAQPSEDDDQTAPDAPDVPDVPES